MISATGSSLVRHRHAILSIAVVLAVSACADRATPRQSLGAVPIDAAVTRNTFQQRSPALRAEPADSLRMLRSLGDTSAFGGIDKIVLLGDRLLVLDYLMNPHLAVVDVRSGRVVEHFGRNGAGPREFRAPHWGFHGNHPQEVWVFDAGNMRLSLLDLSADPEHRVKRTVLMPAEAQVETPTWFGNTLVATGFFPDYALLVMDERGVPIRRVSVDPPFPLREVHHPTGMKLLNRAFFAHDPSRQKIALAYQWADRLDFFAANGAFLGTARGPRSTRASYRIQDSKFFWNDETEMAYWAVAATDTHVFALYAGPAPSKPFEHHPTRVHIFTWRGEFVRELALDRPVYGITVAPDGRTIYAPYAEEDGHQLIGVWQVPPVAIAD